MDKFLKTKYKYRLVLFLIITIMCMISFTACKSSADSISFEIVNSGYANGASHKLWYFSDCVSVQESGMLYFKKAPTKPDVNEALAKGILYYYDFEANNSYSICTKPNCNHLDPKTCIASVPNSSTRYAYYGNKAYCFERKDESYVWNLYEIDIAKQTKNVCCELGNIASKDTNWIVDTISDTHYWNGRVWFVATFLNLDGDEFSDPFNYYSQMISIDLKNGEISFVSDKMLAGSSINFGYFVDDGFIYLVSSRIDEMISFGDYLTSINITQDEYKKFTDEKKLSVSIDFSRETDIKDGCNVYIYKHDKEDNDIFVYKYVSSTIPNTVTEGYVASYGNKILLESGTSLENYTVGPSLGFTILDDDTKEKTAVPNSEEKTINTAYHDGYSVIPYEEGRFLASDDYSEERDKRDIYILDMNSQTLRYLHSVKSGQRFVLVGVTSDKIVGYIESAQSNNPVYCWMYKTDFETGDYKKMHSVKLY